MIDITEIFMDNKRNQPFHPEKCVRDDMGR